MSSSPKIDPVSTASSGATTDPGISLLARLRIPEYRNPVSISVLILFIFMGMQVALRKFKVNRYLPESCILILLGLIAAGIAMLAGGLGGIEKLITHRQFFDILLPPIILDSAYRLYCKPFLLNLDGVLALAVGGTMLNVFAIGACIYLVYGLAHELSILECLLLASIMSAVDPVAVLSVFNEVGVKASLYFLVFGESLFNDGVTVVLFDTLEAIVTVPHIPNLTIFYAFLSFFTIALGGLIIGATFGFITAFFSKHACSEKEKSSGILELAVTVTMAYTGFLCAQLVGWSGIMALIGCGLVQKRYAFGNFADGIAKMVEHGVSATAHFTETIIFAILGFSVISFAEVIYFVIRSIERRVVAQGTNKKGLGST